MLCVFNLPSPPFRPSPLSDLELEERIESFRRRKSIIERKLMDAPPPLVLLRLTDGQSAPAGLDNLFMAVDIQDVLSQCFFCRADGWLGRTQVSEAGTRTCLNCFAVLAAMGYVDPLNSPAKVTVADPRVPRRPHPGPPRKR